MKNKSVFILLATAVSLAGCHKQVGAYEADGSTTTQTKHPVAGTADDISKPGTVPGSPSGVVSQDSTEVKPFKATSVDPSDPTNPPDGGTAVKSGTSIDVNNFNSATTGGQNTSGTTSGARSAGHSSSGTSNDDGSYHSDSRNKGSTP